jgi:hypothetical protein
MVASLQINIIELFGLLEMIKDIINLGNQVTVLDCNLI